MAGSNAYLGQSGAPGTVAMRSPPMSQVVHSPHPQSLTGNRSIPAPGGLPGLIVRVGPPGGDAARAHLDAGHSSDALVEAAANSLVQAAMVGGRLDPARYTTWVQQRVQFLSEIPNAAALFGSVEAAAQTVAAVMGQNRSSGGAQQPQHAPQQGQLPGAAMAQNTLMPLAVSAATSRNPRPRR